MQLANSYAMDMFDEGLGWVVSNYGEINGFVSLEFPWLLLHPPSYVKHLYDIGSSNGKDVWAVGAYGLILHSPNGDDFYINSIPYDWGNNTVWNTQAPGLANASLWKVFFTSPVNGYAVGDNGTILKYSLLEGAPEGPDILDFVVSEQIGNSLIDSENHKIYLKVNPETDITALTPEIFLSGGATIDPQGGEMQDFTNPVTYTVTYNNDQAVVNWTVIVELSTGRFTHKQDYFNVYPNPASEKLYFTMPEFSNSFKLQIVNSTGQIVLFKEYFSGNEVDISCLNTGLYYIRLRYKDKIYTGRFVKH